MRALVFAIVLVALGIASGTAAASADGQVRIYYIAADEVSWNYAPSGMDQVAGKAFDAMQRPYTTRDAHHIGSVYHKAIYREYTDATFRTLKRVRRAMPTLASSARSFMRKSATRFA